MKTKKIKILAIFLFLLPLCVALLGAGCDKNEDYYENIPLEYTKCPCDSEMSFIKKIAIDEILLFDASKTSFSDMKDLSFNGEQSLFIDYTPESNSALVYSIRTTMMGVSNICNFPNIILSWNISEKGDYITLSVDEFELCEPNGAIAANTYSNYVLKVFKKKNKMKRVMRDFLTYRGMIVMASSI